VVILGTRQGAQTDDKGRFRILNVNPGKCQIRALALGYDPVIDSVTVDSVGIQQLRIQVHGPGHIPLAPFRKIPDRLANALLHVRSGQSFRIDPNYDPVAFQASPGDSDQARIGAYRIWKRGSDLTEHDASRFGKLLEDESSYWHPAVGVEKMCIVQFRHGLRLFSSSGDVIECAFCLTCRQVVMSFNEGEESWGAGFDPIDKKVSQLFQRVLPDSSQTH